MWELGHKESWALKNWCFWSVVLEKTLESPLDCKEIKQVNPKVNQPWIFIGRMLKLKLQYFGHLIGRTDSLEKRWTEKSGVLQSMGLQRVRDDRAAELNWSVQLSDVKYIHNVVTTIITIHFQNFFIILIVSLYPLNNNSSLPAPGNLYSAFCLYEFVNSRYLMQVDSYNIWPLFHLAQYFQGSSQSWHVPDFLSLKIIFHCVYIPHFVYLFIRWWLFEAFLPLGYYKGCCYEYWCMMSTWVLLSILLYI